MSVQFFAEALTVEMTSCGSSLALSTAILHDGNIDGCEKNQFYDAVVQWGSAQDGRHWLLCNGWSVQRTTAQRQLTI